MGDWSDQFSQICSDVGVEFKYSDGNLVGCFFWNIVPQDGKKLYLERSRGIDMGGWGILNRILVRVLFRHGRTICLSMVVVGFFFDCDVLFGSDLALMMSRFYMLVHIVVQLKVYGDGLVLMVLIAMHIFLQKYTVFIWSRYLRLICSRCCLDFWGGLVGR